LLVEITTDESTWTTLVNLTTTPWMYPFDTTSVTNDTYKLRASGWDSDSESFALAESGWFDIVNQVPAITTFTVLNPDAGTGASLSDRAWFNIGAQDTLSFRWGASDDDLKQATLSNVPGPGAPATDGPSSLSYGWDWASGNMQEGTWSPRLTVQDNSGLSNTSTLFIGIDRTGPTIGAVTVGDGDAWQQSTEVAISGLLTEADDGQGSGVASVDYALNGGAWTTNNLGNPNGTGAGAVYTIGDSGFSVSGNYVAYAADDSTKGILTNETAATSTWQLFYSGEAFDGNLLAQFGYAVNRGVGSTMSGMVAADDFKNSTNYSLAAAWKPADSGLIPSISTGWSKADDADSTKDYSAWYVGLEWSDAFIAGNSLGAAMGVTPNSATDGDTSTMWEVFYSMPVTDNITVTPAIFGIADNKGATDDVDQFGGLVKTTFKF